MVLVMVGLYCAPSPRRIGQLVNNSQQVVGIGAVDAGLHHYFIVRVLHLARHQAGFTMRSARQASSPGRQSCAWPGPAGARRGHGR
jgi:hypothetical protein